MSVNETLPDGRQIVFRFIGEDDGGTPLDDLTIADWEATTDYNVAGSNQVLVGVLWGDLVSGAGTARTGRETIVDDTVVFAGATVDSTRFRMLVGHDVGMALLDEFCPGNTNPGAGNLEPPNGPANLRYDPITRTGSRVVMEAAATSRIVFDIQEDYFKIFGIGVTLEGDVGDAFYTLFNINADGVVLHNCFGHAELGASNPATSGIDAYRVRSGTTGAEMRNCIAVGSLSRRGGLSGGFRDDAGTAKFYHCIAHNIRNPYLGSRGFVGTGSGTTEAENCVATGCRTSGIASIPTVVRCTTDDGTGSVGYDNYGAPQLFVRPDYWDFRPKLGGFLVGEGGAVDHSASPSNLFDPYRDFNEKDREVAADIGAYQGGTEVATSEPEEIVSRFGTGLDYTDAQQWVEDTAANLVTGSGTNPTTGEDLGNTIQVLELWEEVGMTVELKIGDTSENLAITDDKRYRVIRAAPHLRGRIGFRGSVGAPDGRQIRNYSEPYFRFEGFRMEQTDGASAARKNIQVDADFNIIDGLRCSHTNAAGSGSNRDCIFVSSATTGVAVRNCVANNTFASTGAARGIRHEGAEGEVSNCTAVGFKTSPGEGFLITDSSTRIRNCISTDNVVDFNNSGRMSHCISSDSTAEGLGSQTSVTSASLFYLPSQPTAFARDYRLLETASALGTGVDLSALFSTDIEAAQRTVPWSIGAHALIGSPGLLQMVNPRGSDRMQYTRLFEIRFRDGSTFFLTDFPETYPYRGRTYTPVDSIGTSDVVRSSGFRESGVDAFGVPSATGISEADLVAGRMEGATMVETIVRSRFPFMAPYRVTRYEIQSSDYSGAGWKAELSSVLRQLGRKVGSVTTADCRNRLGVNNGTTSFCSVDVTTFSVYDVPVDSVVDRFSVRGDTTDFPSGTYGTDYFAFGRFEVLDGDNAGRVLWIKEYDALSATFRFWEPAPFDFQVGDKFNAIIGCDGQRSTCQDVFGNYLEFNAEPDTPLGDEARGVPPR